VKITATGIFASTAENGITYAPIPDQGFRNSSSMKILQRRDENNSEREEKILTMFITLSLPFLSAP